MSVTYSADKKIAYYNGERFIRDDHTGYYLSSRKVKETGKRIRLHKYVWLVERGEIPEGCQIHHKDEDKSHNDIHNLECLSEHDHLSYHSAKIMNRPDFKDKFHRLGIKAAKEWHKSKAGHDWHVEQYEKTKSVLYVERSFACINCGKAFKSINTESKFCSKNCKAAFRRASGVDDITVTCAICGTEFRTNKYASAKTCSPECKSKLIWKARRAV